MSETGTMLAGQMVGPPVRRALLASIAAISLAAGLSGINAPIPATAASPAQAHPARVPNLSAGHQRGIIPRRNMGAPVPNNQSALLGANPFCGACSPPLAYRTNSPVAGGLTHASGPVGKVTITPIYWAPAGYSYTANFKSIVNGYVANLAADSGLASNVFSPSNQYYQVANGSSVQPIRWAVTAGAAILDSNPYPAKLSQGNATGCDPAIVSDACVADVATPQTVAGPRGDLQNELFRILNGIHPIDDAHLYMVMFPSNVETCQGPGSASGGQACTSNAYCAYHGGFYVGGSNGYLLYGNHPFPDLSHCVGQLGPQAPNGDAEADAAVSTFSHEANEIITDAFGAWQDSAGYENGDECAYVFGNQLGGVAGSYYNQVVGTGHYWTQDEFSNEDWARRQGDPADPAHPSPVYGCVQREDAPAASFAAPTAFASVAVGFDGTASSDPDSSGTLSYSWAWGDGTTPGSGATPSHIYSAIGSYMVTLTVIDIGGWQGSAARVVGVTGTVPSAPLGLAGNAGTSQVTLSWTAPLITGGSAVLGYQVTTYVGGIAQGTVPTGSPMTSFTVTGLTNGTTYTFAVAATNGVGTGPTSNSSASLTPSAAPYSGLYTLDGYGGIHTDAGIALPNSAYWPGWTIARTAHTLPVPSGAPQTGFVLDGYGGLHSFGAPLIESSGAAGHYWGWNIARDFAFLPDGSGGFVLDGYGGLHPFRLGGSTAPLQALGNPYWGWDIARKIVIFADGKGGYVMDGWGGLHPFGINAAPAVTAASLTGGGYWPGWDIARDLALLPGNGGHSGYVLDGFGGAHPFHPVGDGVMPPAIQAPYWGWDIARTLWLSHNSTTSIPQGFVMDGYGGLQSFGGIPTPQHPYWPGWDIARTIAGQ